MMNPLVLLFFSDELQKEAGVGSTVVNAIKSAPGAVMEGVKETGRLAKGFVKNPAKSMAAGARGGWHKPGHGIGTRAMIFGGTGMGVGMDAATKNDPATGRRLGAGERVGRVVGGATTGLAAAPAGIIAGSAVGLGGAALGARAGKLVDKGINKLRGKHE